MTDKKFTDEEIVKALECCLKAKNDAECRKFGCPARLENGRCFYEEEFFSEEECLKQMLEDALSLINRQKAEIDNLIYKLECLLCHVTGSRLSKHSYALRTMETVATDCINETYNDGYGEGYKDAAREIFAEIEEIIKDPHTVGFSLLIPLNQALKEYNEGIRKEKLYYITELKKKYTEGET